MLPVALGLGLINFNLVVNTLFAARFVDPDLAPARDRRSPSASTCFPRGSSRSRSPPFSSRCSHGSPRARTCTGSATRCRSACARSRFLLIPASAVGAVLAVPIVRLLYQRGAFTAGPDDRRRRSARRVHGRSRVQRHDADAQPRVLQPAVAMDPDVRSRSAISALNAALDRGVLPRRNLGHPARDVDRQHRRQCGAARSCCADGSVGSTAARSRRFGLAHRDRVRTVRRGGVRRLAGARRGPRALARRAGRCRSGWRSLASVGGIPRFRPFAGNSRARGVAIVGRPLRTAIGAAAPR